VESAGNTHVVYLRYADAGNIATILTNVGQNALKAEAKNVGGGSAGDSVNVQADEESNALVITAPASIFPSLRSVIQQLDIPRAQVHIEAIIAEVSLTTAEELGVQWLLRSSQPGVVGSSQFSTFLPSIGDVAGGIVDGVRDSILPDGGLLGLGNIDDDGLTIVALIRALEGDGETNLLSTPSLVTLDNQEAEIIVGQNVPFVTGQSTGVASTTNNPFQTIERQDIGVSLKVKPQINEGNAITMEINQEVSDIAASSEGAVDIVTTKRAITTTVQIEDGELLVLGGLISDKLIKIEQKVPFLGDLPVIGALFRSTSTEKGKQNLMVFIRATIIKDPNKARALSAKKYNFLRDLQLEHSGDDQLGPALAPYDELGITLYEFESEPLPDE
jgi:general secretion pathway protein D